MRFTVLGPITVNRDGVELAIGGPKQRTVLALLLAARGEVVSVANLIDGVWGENEPATAKKALQVYVHHLRGEIGAVLRTEAGGYALDTRGELDAEKFEFLAAQVEEQRQSDPVAVAGLARQALGLWTGRCYGGLTDAPGLASEIAHLDNLRLGVLGDRLDADLALGRHASLIGELEGLIEEYPLHERFRSQLMLALYRSGRQVESLRLFDRTRRYLAEEVGLDPTPELSDLQQKVFAHDPSLSTPTTSDHVDALRGYELCEVIASHGATTVYRGYQRSIGREVLISVLDAPVADDPIFIANHVSDARRVAGIDHPHVSQVFDTWREPGRAYQVGRWLGGGTLAARLVDGPLSLAAAHQTIDEIGGALAQAHRQGVAHGAIGSGAVWFDDAGHAYLREFCVGLAGGQAAIAADTLAFSSLTHELLTGLPLPTDEHREIPSRDSSGLDPAIAGVFGDALSGRFDRIEDFARALRQASGVDVIPLADEFELRAKVRNPYKGLKAFQETDAADFHGRTALTEKLQRALDTHRLVAVVGPSGSGKSSAVKAGLASALRSSDRLTLITEMYPGAYPFEELEGALVQVSVKPAKVMQDLLGDERGLIRVLKQILPDDGSEVLLIIDQFEELFSLTRSVETRKLFLDNLVHAVSDPRSRLRVALTMRADFFDRPLEHPEFGRLVETGLVPVAVMNEAELAQAIAAPAAAVGVDFEPGLVPHIVRDVTQQVGGLPLLQFALTEVFEQRVTNTISLQDYQACGGILGALATRAEQTYLAMDAGSQSALQHALLRMVAVGDGSDDLRLRVRRSDLHADRISDQSLTDALTVFGAHRLLTFDLDPVTRGPTVEVAHEALLREWPRLSGWIDAQRDELVVRRRLAAAMVEWRDSGNDASYLPVGGRLAQFEDWSASTVLELAAGERQFLQLAMEHERDRESAAARRRQGALVGSIVAAVVLALIAGFALVQRSNANVAAAEAETARVAATDAAFEAETARVAANDAAFEAETSRLAATAQNVSGTLPELGLLVAAESHNRDVTPETLGSLQRVLVDASELSTQLTLGFGSSGISADGELLSVWNTAQQSQGPLFDISGATPVPIEPPRGPIDTRHPMCSESPFGCPGVFSSWVDFAQGGDNLLVQFVDGVLHVYANHDFNQPRSIIRNTTVRFAASPDGSLFAHGTYCKTVEEFDALTTANCPSHGFSVVDLETGEIVFALPEDSFARAFSWSADGTLLHRVDDQGRIGAWDTQTWTEVDFLGGDLPAVTAIEHPVGGDFVAVTTDAGEVILLDAETGAELNTISGLISTRGTATTAFSSDGELMLSVLPGVVRLWDTRSGEQIGVPFVNEANAPRAQSGEVIQLATEIGGVIHVWNLDTATWFDRACEAAGRNMTRSEWDQFGPRDTEYRATCPQWTIDS